jgi:RNA polymerase sigma-70 factor (ECF subfamily)
MVAAARNRLPLRTAPGAPSPTRVKAESAEARIDVDLVSAYRAGNERAFVAIMTRYSAKIFNTTFALLRNYADAEEITQDTFIRAHRGLANFRGDSSLGTWLHRIAVNLSRNRYWYFFRRRRHDSLSLDCAVSPDSSATLGDFLGADGADPAQESVAREFVSLVDLCMESLDAPHREILTLRNRFHGSYDEIATLLQINVGTVKSRIARARLELRKLVGKAFSADPEQDTRTWFLPRTTRETGRIRNESGMLPIQQRHC